MSDQQCPTSAWSRRQIGGRSRHRQHQQLCYWPRYRPGRIESGMFRPTGGRCDRTGISRLALIEFPSKGKGNRITRRNDTCVIWYPKTKKIRLHSFINRPT